MTAAEIHDGSEYFVVWANDSTRKTLASENRADSEAVDGDTESILDTRSVSSSNEYSTLAEGTTAYVLGFGKH